MTCAMNDSKLRLLASFAFILLASACGRDGGEQAATPPASPAVVPPVCAVNVQPTPGCTSPTVCQPGFIQTERGCLQQGVSPCGTNEGYDPATRLCYRGIVNGVVGRSYHFQARLSVVNRDQFAWFLEQKSREVFGSPICLKNNAFGNWSCNYYSSEAVLDLGTPSNVTGTSPLYTVSISPGRANYPIPLQMAYYPTGENSGFTLQENYGYAYTRVRAVRGSLNDNTIDIEVIYKDIVIATGQLTRSF